MCLNYPILVKIEIAVFVLMPYRGDPHAGGKCPVTTVVEEKLEKEIRY